MITRFVTIQVPLLEAMKATELQRSILKALDAQGEPLRWAITQIDRDAQTAQIEAVVLTPTQFAIPFNSVQTV